jgi:hypothetical protein
MLNRTGSGGLGISSFLALALVLGLVAASDFAMAAKGGKGGGQGGSGGDVPDLTRITVDQPANSPTLYPRIGWDLQATATVVNDVEWDYWDYRDAGVTGVDVDTDTYACRIDVSGGGRVKFFTTMKRPRWFTLDLTPNPYDPAPMGGYWDEDNQVMVIDPNGGPDIDAVYYGSEEIYRPEINPDTYIDNVKFTITLSEMFKKNVTRQELEIQIRKRGENGWVGSGWNLRSVNDLYVIPDPDFPDDPTWRTLTTLNPDSGFNDVAEFHLRYRGPDDDVSTVVGKYFIPLSWRMQLVR